MSVDIDSLKKDPRALNLFRSRLKMKKDGGEWVGLCAFHSESSPSFRVSLHDGVWVFKCFGCSCSGNVLQFVQKLDGVSYTTAIETVKSFYGGSWEENKQQVESVFKPLDVSETKEYVTYSLSDYRKYEDAFDSNSEAIAFLLDRGISYDSAKRLRLGFKQDGNKRTKQECPDIHDKGWLSMPRIEGDRVVGVKFRSIVKGRKEMWQMMGMKTTLFNTNTIDPLDDVFVVEGEMDCVIMEQAGFRSVSIPSGSTKITPEMKDKIMQANRVILAGDCDGKVGTAAMQKLWTDLQERTYLVIWPNECKDANETFLKESKANIEDFQNLVNLLVVKSVGSPIPNVSSMQEIMLSGDDPILIDHPERLRFPWKGVDEMAVLLPGSVLFLTATETGTGKSTLAEQFTMYGARKHGEVVVCYSSELTPYELSTIAAAQILGKDRREISGEDRKEAAHQLNGVQYYVGHDPAIQTIGAALDLLEAAIRRLGGTLAVLDNFHHLCRNEEKEIKVQENSSQRIKRMAGQLRCKMVVLGAPRKSDKSGVGKRLALADIRGAQALQDDADAVFFMHRKRTPGQELEFEPITEIQRQKARSCGTGNAFTRLYFHGAKATFTELETQQEGI